VKRLLLVLALLILPSVAGAVCTETFYLRAAGDGSAPHTIAGGYDAADFNTAGNWDSDDSADDKIGPNDCVIVLDNDGSFTTALTVQQSGLLGKQITLQGETGGTSTIAAVAAVGITVSAKNYITIDGLTITSWTGRGIHAIDVNGLIVNDCTISGGNGVSPDHGIQVQLSAGGLQADVRITNNTIGTIGTAENNTVGFNGIIVQGVTGVVISRNTINTTNSMGLRHILAGASDNVGGVIEYNNFYDCFGNMLVSNSDGTIIRYNHIHDGKGIGIGISFDADDVQIYYNLIHDLPVVASGLWNGIDINNDSQNGRVYNNTVHTVWNNALVIDDATAACNGWIFKNNIFDASDGTGTHLPLRTSGVTYTSDNNVLYPFQDANLYVAEYNGTSYNLADYRTNSSQDAISLNSDPLFVSASDPHLQSTSPARAVGTNLSLKWDYTGAGLPATPDIGAYQYGWHTVFPVFGLYRETTVGNVTQFDTRH
jgi:hypothetical protein